MRFVVLVASVVFASPACQCGVDRTPMFPFDAGLTVLDASVGDAGERRFEGFAADQVLDGGSRGFHVYAPPRAPGELRPLVVLLHGNGGSADQVLGRTGMAAPFKRWLEVAARERVFLLVPNGTVPVSGQRGWNDCRGDAPTNPMTDDVGAVLAVVDSLLPQGVDPSAVFATGISNGGHFALRLAIEAPSRFRAVAPVAAAMPAQSRCAAPTRPVSVLFINGTADPILPYDGGTIGEMDAGRGSVLSTPASVELWRRVNGVTEPEVSTAIPDAFPGDRCTATDVTSRAGWPTVRLLRVEGGGHTEPSPSERYSGLYLLVVGRQNGDVEFADFAWRFFASQR